MCCNCLVHRYTLGMFAACFATSFVRACTVYAVLITVAKISILARWPTRYISPKSARFTLYADATFKCWTCCLSLWWRLCCKNHVHLRRNSHLDAPPRHARARQRHSETLMWNLTFLCVWFCRLITSKILCIYISSHHTCIKRYKLHYLTHVLNHVRSLRKRNYRSEMKIRPI